MNTFPQFDEPPPPPPPLDLKVYAPDAADEADGRDPKGLRKREAFEVYLRPGLLSTDSKGNLSAYEQALKHWEQRSTDPPVNEVTTKHWLEVRKTMLEQGFAAETINKTARHLRAIMRRLGPPTDGNPRGEGILDRTPYYEMLRTATRHPRTATFEELNVLYDACSYATWPNLPEVPAPRYWRAALVGVLNLGPRAWELFAERPEQAWSREKPKAGWRWQAYDLAGGWLEYWIPKAKALHRVPVGRVLAAHLASIRTERACVFPATCNRNSIYSQWRCLKAIAATKIPEIADLDLHDIRRTCQTEWDSLKMGLGDHIVWHTPTDVGGMHYRNFSKLAKTHVDDLPQPEAFFRIFEQGDGEKQLHLF